MNIKGLEQNAQLEALQQALSEGESILVEELWNSTKALVAALAAKATGKHVLILTGASQEEFRLLHDFAFFTDKKAVDYPAWETLPSENVPPSPDIVGDRYKVLQAVSSSAEPIIILSSLQACLQKLIPRSRFCSLHLSLKTGESFSFEKLIKHLNDSGYMRRAMVTEKGEFAVRGGIIDVFPVSSPDPYRIEFWGDEIESMRAFDPIGQKSILPVTEISLPPAQELELIGQAKQLVTIADYLGPGTLVIFDDLLALEDRYASLVNMGGGSSSTFCSINQFLDQIEPLQKIFWSAGPIEELAEIKILEKKEKGYYSQQAPMLLTEFEMLNRTLKAKRWRHPFAVPVDFLLPGQEEPSGQELLSALGGLSEGQFHVHFVCSSELEHANLRQRLMDAMIALPGHSTYHTGYLTSGFIVPESRIAVIPMTEITRRYKIHRPKQRSTYHSLPIEVLNLVPGETVVHLHHGIGKFLGLEKKVDHNGILNEFFALEYAGQAKLFVPLSQAHLISKYIGSGEEVPKFHTIGSTRWKATKERTEQAILRYADDLLEMYAKREMKGGFAYPDDSGEMHDFEEDFPFVETEDQLSAIANIKQDMCSTKAMDRLVCGDVGYGKTEVAMRAAFKAVADGRKQVAVLVPTTVLAMQHYETFQDRMSNFPINIGVLSRFLTPKKVRETLEGVAKGSIDILVGTHRIISEDVVFKDLGLVIIDEEQRFGVKAKEHLKKVKEGVDCLTLSATPIPRTLYMSLIGARDMSVISTPPQDRLPITSIIAEPNDQLIKNALLRELARDGQAYVIHNRVETIYDMSAKVKKLLPQARTAVVHAQMSSDEIDEVFHAFKKGRADILIATTIVENGIDIPNANTILIDRADRFGMSDLYQLRGRTGRWNRRAYCYFLVPRLHAMPEISRKRLQALAESSGYGGGMKIAMHDLEIRGAGNILGLEQSGHVSAIGFHLYCKMLKRAMQTLQGKTPGVVCELKMEAAVDARLPDDYVNETTLRMEIYQRLGEALSVEDVEGIWKEMRDRFGPPPLPAQWLYHLSRLRVQASLKGYTLIKVEKIAVYLEKQSGKKTQTSKVLFSLPKTPKEFEAKLLKLL